MTVPSVLRVPLVKMAAPAHLVPLVPVVRLV